MCDAPTSPSERRAEDAEAPQKRARTGGDPAGDVPEDDSGAGETAQASQLQWIEFDSTIAPRCVAQASAPWSAPLDARQHPASAVDPLNFTKGVKFSPDGSRLLVASDDCRLRVLDASNVAGGNLPVCTVVKEGETIYDYSWYPYHTPSDAASCCFVATSRETPIHLWDSNAAKLRASYVAYDHLDEPIAANCVSFDLQGGKIYAGYNRCVRVFDVSRPGRQCQQRFTCKTRKTKLGQRGILSCIAFNPDYSGVYAVGSYAGTAVIYSENDGEALLELPCQPTGVSHVKFAANGNYLFVGGRQHPNIQCWDIRMTLRVVCSLPRAGDTNQRLYFDVEPCGRHLITGSKDAQAIVYDLNTGERVRTIDGMPDAVNGVSIHPAGGTVALSTGQRHFPLPEPYHDAHTGASASSALQDSEDSECDGGDGGGTAARTGSSVFPQGSRSTVSVWSLVKDA